MGTLLVGAAVAGIAALAVRSILRDKRAGRPQCGGDCRRCGGHCR